jgi:glycosyltransferase involved in cell wall biosynthesis
MSIKVPITVVALMEANTVTGPVKNMLNFFTQARHERSTAATDTVHGSIITFVRKGSNNSEPGDSKVLTDETVAHNQFVRKCKELGIEVDLITEESRFDRQVLSQLRAVIERRKPDLIQTHHVKSHFLLALTKSWKQIPWLAFHHGYTTTDLKMQAYNQLDRWSLRMADKVITVCGPFRDELIQKGVSDKRIEVLHNSVREATKVGDDARERLRQRLSIGNDERVLLAVGRLSREKAHSDLLVAAAHLRRNYPQLNFKLLIVGEGPELVHLKRIIEELDLDASVILVGQVEDTSPYYAIADALVLPSHSEGSPNVLLEGLAFGVPIVATDVGGVPEMITNGANGLLVTARDPTALAERMAEVLSNSALAARLVTEGKRRVRDEYSPEAYRTRLISIYYDVLRNREQASAALSINTRGDETNKTGVHG